MSFWTYMLHCADQSFYVGHTDDLEKRVAQHEAGVLANYTATRLPVKLVWSQDFGTRDEAKQAEQQLKGWGKPKKLALIRGDWSLISALAKGEGRASTSSARTVFRWDGGLHPHLSSIPPEALSLEVAVRRSAGRVRLRYRLCGDLDQLRLSPPGPPQRHDELWRSTCFEAFIGVRDDPAYSEFNFAPSGAWAAYSFDRYREGMTNLASEPSLAIRREKVAIVLTAQLAVPPIPLRLGLSAVIEQRDGTKSYWALNHPDPEKPDFHDPAGFVLDLPAA